MGRDFFTPNARRLFQSGSYAVNFDEPFIYTGGKIGPVYINCGKIQNHSTLWEGAVQDLAYVVRGLGSVDRIAGGEVRDLIFSPLVAYLTHKPHVIIRKQATTHGAGGRLITDVGEREDVVVVSDLLTKGTSGLQWIEAVREVGGRVPVHVNYVDRLQGGKETLEEQGVKVVSLVQMTDGFLDVGVDEGVIAAESRSELDEYLARPDEWARTYLRENPDFLTRNTQMEAGQLVNGEGVKVLAVGYPDLLQELGPGLQEHLAHEGFQWQLKEL